jgi:glycosyltransferase involved in cell wall biosynthesis
MTLLSISIPTFNRTQQLLQSLQNLKKILAAHKEFVEVNVYFNQQESTVSPSILQIKEHFNFHFSDKNKGIIHNLNKCLLENSAKYSMIFPDDEILIPQALSSLLNILGKQEYDLIFYNRLRKGIFRSRPEFAKDIQPNFHSGIELANTCTKVLTEICYVSKNAFFEKTDRDVIQKYGPIAHFLSAPSINGLVFNNPLVIRSKQGSSFWTNHYPNILIAHIVWLELCALIFHSSGQVQQSFIDELFLGTKNAIENCIKHRHCIDDFLQERLEKIALTFPRYEPLVPLSRRANHFPKIPSQEKYQENFASCYPDWV